MRGRAETVARRLAQALLDAAVAHPAGPAAARDTLAAIDQLFAQCPEARTFLDHPLVPSEAKAKVIAAITGSTAGSDPVAQLLRILATRQALGLLGRIETRFIALWNARRGVVAAETISATPLAAATVQDLRSALERASRRSVELTTTVDPALMGGVIVRVAGRTLDGSVRGRLKALRGRLRQAATR
jgi:F-type H+-transporting ATPase subunit delta